ncbi:MAG: tetratricopeptide repeat protein [Leptolyngbyaceae bacterium]|nr:tetratricopeptide repeat protein [Leptolyngbyaceae bacterium]
MDRRTLLQYFLAGTAAAPLSSYVQRSARAATPLVVQITEDTVFKRRPLLSRELLQDDEKLSKEPCRIYLHSYAYAIPGEDLKGHVKVAFEGPVQGFTTWYIWSAHCRIWNGTQMVFPNRVGLEQIEQNLWSWEGVNHQPEITTPLNGEVLLNRGVVIASGINEEFAGDYPRALEHFQMAAERAPQLVSEAHYQQGIIHAISFYEVQDQINADPDADENLRQIDTPIIQGIRQQAENDKNQALAQFTQAIQADADNFSAYLERGVLHSVLDSNQIAVDDFTQAIRLREHPELHFRRAIAYEELGALPQALDDYKYVVEYVWESVDAVEFEPPSNLRNEQRLVFYKGLANFYARDFTFSRVQRSFASVFYPNTYQILTVAENNGGANNFDYDSYSVSAVAARANNLALSELRQTTPETAEEYLDRGSKRLELNDQAGALQDFERASELDPSLAESYYRLGLATVDEDQAIAFFTQAIEQQPDFAFAYFHRAVTSLNRVGSAALRDLFQTEEILYERTDASQINDTVFNRVIGDFDKAIQSKPDFAIAYYEQGRTRFYSRGFNPSEVTKALDDYMQAVRRHPFFIRAYTSIVINASSNIKANSKFLNKLYPDSDAVLERVAPLTEMITQNPDNLDAYYQRAQIFYEANQLNEADNDLSEIIQRDSSYLDVYEKRGVTRYRLQQYQAAIEDLNQALEKDPIVADSYVVRGLAYFELNNYQEALNDVKQAVWLHPLHTQAHLLRIQLHNNLGQEALPKETNLETLQWIVLKGWERLGITFPPQVGGGSYSQSSSSSRPGWR